MTVVNILAIIALLLALFAAGGIAVYGLVRIASIAYFRTKQGFVRSLAPGPSQGREDYDE